MLKSANLRHQARRCSFASTEARAREARGASPRSAHARGRRDAELVPAPRRRFQKKAAADVGAPTEARSGCRRRRRPRGVAGTPHPSPSPPDAVAPRVDVPATHVAGTRPGLHGHTLVSSGLADLDNLLGGGVPLGTVVVLGTDGDPASAGGNACTLLRYFVAEGAPAGTRGCGYTRGGGAAPGRVGRGASRGRSRASSSTRRARKTTTRRDAVAAGDATATAFASRGSTGGTCAGQGARRRQGGRREGRPGRGASTSGAAEVALACETTAACEIA